MPSENYGGKAGEGVKGVFKSINDIGETLRGNINGALDGFGDAITGNHAQSRGSTGASNDSEKMRSNVSNAFGSHGSTGVLNDSEKVRRDINQGLDDAGKKVEEAMHHKK